MLVHESGPRGWELPGRNTWLLPSVGVSELPSGLLNKMFPVADYFAESVVEMSWEAECGHILYYTF